MQSALLDTIYLRYPKYYPPIYALDLSSDLFSLKFPSQDSVCISRFPMRGTCPTLRVLHDLLALMTLGEDHPL